MPSFTIRVPDLSKDGPRVEILIAPTRALVELLKQQNKKPPDPIRIIALIDTGATGSVVKQSVIAQLGITPTGVQKTSTPSTTTPINYPIFDVGLALPNRIYFEVPIISMPLQGQTIDCLIGRDVLQHVILVYNGYDNNFTFSY